MSPCRHVYDDDRPDCPHFVPDGASLCLWHNATIDKTSPYVIDLLEQALRMGAGDMEGAHLEGLIWPGAQLAGARLRGAHLEDAVLTGADLSGADLTDADLTRANLRGAILSKACLHRAHLNHAHLGEARLDSADLSGAKIHNTVFLASDLRHADLGGAEVEDFFWNRLTRFSGITGLEPTEMADLEDDEADTQRFIAPVAMGAHDLDQRRISRGSDPELQRTRLYRSDIMPAPPQAMAPVNPPDTHSPAGDPRTPQLRRQIQILRLAAAAAILIATLATAMAVFLRYRMPDGVAPPETDTHAFDQQEREAYQSRLAALDEQLREANRRVMASTSSLERQREHLAEARGLVAELEDSQRFLVHENARLRSAHDEAVIMRDRLHRLTAAHDRLAERNQALEQTSQILTRGLRDMRQQKEHLERHVYGDQLANEHRIRELDEANQGLNRELSEARTRLLSQGRRNAQLEAALTAAEHSLASFTRRIQGTQLESLLLGDPAARPLLRLQPGRTIALGGDVLVTLTVDIDEDHEPLPDRVRIRSELVVQGPPGQDLPEVSIAFYDHDDLPLRKISYAFPARIGTTGFANAVVSLDSPSFPAGARLLLTDSSRVTARND